MKTATLLLVVALSLLVGFGDAEAQAPVAVPRIGFLGNTTPELEANLLLPFLEGLREYGYADGQNVLIEYRWAEGRYDRLPSLIAELLAQKVDVIVTAGTPATRAVKKATASVPLVMIAVGDPVGTGIVPSLSRPGGNITGLTSISPELDGKRLELLREIAPAVSHIAVLWNSASSLQIVAERATRVAADAMRMKMLSLGVRTRDDIENAFATIVAERPATFELVLNAKTAKVLGLALPQSLLLRADRIIE